MIRRKKPYPEVTIPGLGRVRVRPDRAYRVERYLEDTSLHRGNAGDGWQTLTRRELLALDAETWEWLRSVGVRRPSPSGPSGPTQPEADRSTVQVLLRLAPDVAARLRARAAAERRTVAAVVTMMIERGS